MNNSPENGVLDPSYGTGDRKKSAQVTLHCGMNQGVSLE